MQRCATCGKPTRDPYKTDGDGNIYDSSECYAIRASQEFLDSKGGTGTSLKLPGIGYVDAPINNARNQPIYAEEHSVNIGRGIDGELWKSGSRDK